MKDIILVKTPSNLGLKEPSTGKEPGVKFFPEALLQTGFAKEMNVTHILGIEPPSYSTEMDPETRIRNVNAIRKYSERLGDTIAEWTGKGFFPIVIGGDCSILVGCMQGLKKTGRYGLFFLDGHTDFMLPQHSQTAGAAGMDLALVTGHGPETLTDINGLRPYIEEQFAFCVGNREYVDWYVDLIEHSRISYFDLERTREEGIENVVSGFLRMVETNDLDGFWIHFDVDALNDAIMPCVDSRNKDGFDYAEMQALLRPLLASGRCRGIDITIFDPTLDEDGRYIRGFSEGLLRCFGRFLFYL